MADITLTFADEKIGEIRRAYAAATGWRDQELDGPRPAYVKRMIRKHIRDTVRQFRAAEAAAALVVDDAVGDEPVA